MSRIVLGVAGGIAAYKACDLLRRLLAEGHDVTVVPTPSALEFVGATTWAALSGKPVHTQVWDDAHQVPHVALGQNADLVIVAPATADLLARAAAGRADGLLTNVLLTTTAPVVLAPAMHTEMWRHPATAANVATLRSRGVVVLEPASGRLTGADSGPGRLPEPAELLAVAASILAEPGVAAHAAARDLAGLRVLVTAGGTRENLDPVRFLGNASSGRMGWALARAAAVRGASVELVAAHVEADPPPGVWVTSVGTTAELAAAVAAVAREQDVVVMAAAPADYTPVQTADTKIKKDAGRGLSLELRETPDVLAGLVAARADRRQVLVGFAAETGDGEDSPLALGRAKLRRKGCDLLVLNEVGHGRVFARPDSEITLLTRQGEDGPVAGSKDVLAHRIWDAVVALRARR